MAKIEAFEAYRYNPDVVEDLAKVVCPPYDVIDAQGQDAYYQKNPYNTIRLILGKEMAGDNEAENKYTRAAGYLQEWQRRGILIKESAPALYFYEQAFTVAGARHTRLGFLGLMRLDDEGQDRSIHPHEHTHIAPKEDRLRLVTSVEANLSPIFTIFSDPKAEIKSLFTKSVKKEAPLFDIADEKGGEDRLWRVTDKDLIEKIKAFISNRELFIADGHHRHEVSRMFRDIKKKQDPLHFKDSYHYIMTYFTALEDSGLCILPTHRLVRDITIDPRVFEPLFSVKEVVSRDALVDEMKKTEDAVGAFGLYAAKKFYLLKVADKRGCNQLIQEGPREYKDLDVVILQKVIFDHLLKAALPQIGYEIDLDRCVAAVDSGAVSAAFILHATKVEQIRSIALGGEVMPQKSTYFYPKLLSGLLINKF